MKFGSEIFPDENLIETLSWTDPRKDTTLYDILVRENLKKSSVIGNISEVLLRRKSIDKSSHISKYKLIYYSPYYPSQLTTKQKKLNTTSDQNVISENLFSVDVNDGKILMKSSNESALEYLCVKRNFCLCFSCLFTLNIIYSTENKINADSIKVFIDDFNEKAPEFYSQSSEFTISLSELSQIGDSFLLSNSLAFDRDIFYNLISYYVVDHEFDLFSQNSEMRSTLFDVSLVSQESRNLNLILKAHLDYEIAQNLTLYLVAEDNGSPKRLKSYKRLIVNIIDENDHSPVCEKSLFISYINENEKMQNILQIKASDLDSGINGQLKFSLSANSSELLEIDPESGWLSLKNPLDYEKKSSYDFTVEVSDSGIKNVYKTFCSARINILDLNDNPAKMKVIKYLNESEAKNHFTYNVNSDSGNEIELYENNKNDQILALIRIFDKDSLSNYFFVVESDSDEPQENVSAFEMRISDRSHREFELITTKAFDAEVCQNYKIKLILYDLNESPKGNNFKEDNFKRDKAFQVSKIFLLNKNSAKIRVTRENRIIDDRIIENK